MVFHLNHSIDHFFTPQKFWSNMKIFFFKSDDQCQRKFEFSLFEKSLCKIDIVFDDHLFF